METETIENDIVARFNENLLADGKCPSTIASYIGDISAFLD